MNLHDFVVRNPRLYHLSQQILSGNKRILKKIVRSELAKLSPSPRRVLDLGCGTGLLSPVFADDVYTGIDIDPKYIELARGNYPNKSFLISGGQKLHFPDGHFDFVLLSCTLHHTDDTMAQNILSEVRRILRKPNGRCLLIDNIQPIKKNFLSSWYANRDEGDFIRTKDAYKKLVESALVDIKNESIVKDYPLGSLFFVPSYLYVFLLS